MDLNLQLNSIADLRLLYSNGNLTPVDVCNYTFSLIEKYNPKLNAFAHLDPEFALDLAQKSALRWAKQAPKSKIDGMLISIKDCIPFKNWPYNCGSRVMQELDELPESHAPVVNRLLEAGAIIFGTTNMSEFGFKGVTDNCINGITRNPWDTSLTPGGSSGGAAVAVAMGMGIAAIGSDAGGSIRIPASFTGTFGLKPTRFTIPELPISTEASLNTLGIISRSSQDCLDILSVIGEPDPKTAFYMPMNPFKQDSVPDQENGIKIGVIKNITQLKTDPEIEKAFNKFTSNLQQQGVSVTEIDLEQLADAETALVTIWLASLGFVADSLEEEQRNLLDPLFLSYAQQGKKITLNEYLGAKHYVNDCTLLINEVLEEYDFLLSPTVASLPFPVEQSSPSGEDEIYNWTPYTTLFNLTGHPAISLPIGYSENDLPIGAQLATKFYNEVALINFSDRLENECNLLVKKSPTL